MEIVIFSVLVPQKCKEFGKMTKKSRQNFFPGKCRNFCVVRELRQLFWEND